MRLLITAGPTREALDPVRFLTNRSSGRMGFALAAAAAEAGARVTLVAGPVHLPTPDRVQRVDVVSALDMLGAVEAAVPGADVFIATAAVADYRPATVAEQKIKKSADTLALELVKNPDIVATVAARADRPFVVGFAAETERVLEHARAKLERKRLDLIAANEVGDRKVFDQDDNALLLLWPQGGRLELGAGGKLELARRLLDFIVRQRGGGGA